jgi:hypothetical protein
MDKLTVLLGFLATLSLATERLTETIKGLPILSRWLAVEKASGSTAEEFRKASIHFVAIGIGMLLAAMTQDQLAAVMGGHPGVGEFFLFGAMASGGSGLWNSALDIVREVNRQKQLLNEQLKTKAIAAPTN